ncbi:MAG: Fur family transcriptional regulator [Eubacteriales bacterium]
MNTDKLIQIIKNNGYKITPQRKIILSILCQRKNNLLSIYDINDACNKQNVTTNITTIYRNMDILTDCNLVHKVLSQDGTSLYQLNCIEDHHHHIICKQCGKTEVIDYCPLNTLKKLSDSKSFQLTEHKLELYGYCKNCFKNNN